MSNDKNTKAPAAIGNTQGGASEPVRIRTLRFVGKGIILTSGKEALDNLIARGGSEQGYDIWYHPEQRRFRFENHVSHIEVRRRWMHETRIDSYQEWDDNDQPSSAA